MNGPDRLGLAVVGHLSIDDIHAEGAWHRGQPGGSVVYAALAARLGNVVPRIFAVAGGDYPRNYLSSLSKAGIDTSGIRWSTASQRKAVFAYDRAEHRMTAAADDTWLRDTERTAPEAPPPGIDADGFLLCPAAPLIQVAWARHAQELGRPVFLDTSDPYVAFGEGQLETAIKYADFFLPSESQLRLLFPGSTRPQAMKLASQLGPRVVVVKRGASGTAVYDGLADRYAEYRGFPQQATDPTGAGDALCGGFAAGWLVARELEGAVASGMAAGRIAVTGVGPDCLLKYRGTLAELAAHLIQVPDG